MSVEDGTVTGTVVNAGGLQVLDTGSTAADTTVNGFQYVGGTASGLSRPLDGGGFMDIGAGGVATDINLVNGWSHIGAGGSAQGVGFGGFSGRLQVDNPSGLTGTISNFEVRNSIDLFNTSVSSFSFDGSTLTLATNSGSFSYQFRRGRANRHGA